MRRYLLRLLGGVTHEQYEMAIDMLKEQLQVLERNRLALAQKKTPA